MLVYGRYSLNSRNHRIGLGRGNAQDLVIRRRVQVHRNEHVLFET